MKDPEVLKINKAIASKGSLLGHSFQCVRDFKSIGAIQHALKQVIWLLMA